MKSANLQGNGEYAVVFPDQFFAGESRYWVLKNKAVKLEKRAEYSV
jgi:hypothetical protein